MEENKNITKELLEDIFVKRRNIFLTGSGGTGKSFLIKYLKTLEKQYNVNISLTSTTGTTAYNINGTTIHRWSGVRIGKEPVNIIINRILFKDKKCKLRWLETDILIIDEVSMLSDKLFELIIQVGKSIKNGKFPQLILVGDFMQLSPISGNYVFQSELWNTFNFKTHILTHPYRFTDLNYFHLLSRVRLAEHTPDDIKLLQTRVEAYKKYRENIKNVKDTDIKPTRIYSRKVDVARENLNELDKLPFESFTYKATDQYLTKYKPSLKSKTTKNTIVIDDVEYEHILNPENKDDYSNYLDENIVSESITLKKCAQVMLKKNLDVESGLTNGSRGVVVDLASNYVEVLFKNGIKQKIMYQPYDFEDESYKIIRQQMPLILAYSVTIHTIQGSSLDFAIIDAGTSVFSPAMAYVALSRVRSLDGLFIINLLPNKIYADKVALEFEKKLVKGNKIITDEGTEGKIKNEGSGEESETESEEQSETESEDDEPGNE